MIFRIFGIFGIFSIPLPAHLPNVLLLAAIEQLRLLPLETSASQASITSKML